MLGGLLLEIFFIVLVPLRIVAQDVSSRPPASNVESAISNISTLTRVSTEFTTIAGSVVTLDGETSTTTYSASVSTAVVPGSAEGPNSSPPAFPFLTLGRLSSSTSQSFVEVTTSATISTSRNFASPSTTSRAGIESRASSMSSISSVASSSALTTSPTTLATSTLSKSTPLAASSASMAPTGTMTSTSQSVVTSLMTMTATSTPSSSPRPSKRQRDVIIALSVVLGVLFIVFFLFAIFYLRRWYKRRTSITRTGDSRLDAEIEGWRSSKGTTEGANLTGGDRRSSTSQREWDDEKMLQRPPTAKAPNARSGLTDSAVPGADPFVSVRRNSSKLQKRSTSRPGSRPGSMLGHHRSQSSFSITDRPPVSSDRPLTPREPIMESMAEKEAPPLPVDAEETIRNSLGSSKSHRVSS